MTVFITLVAAILLLFLQIHLASFYTKVVTDYDLYGIKIAMNDHFTIIADNLDLAWWIFPVSSDSVSYCSISYNKTTCDFVYSVIVPVSNISSFVYNCIDLQGQNVVGFFVSNDTCTFYLNNEQSVSNYSTQDNYVIDVDGQNTGVYGFADDFMFYYELDSTFQLTVWPNTLNISPRAVDIGSNVDYAVLVGYCQSTVSIAFECAFVVLLNRSLSCPNRTNVFHITGAVNYSFSDPRITHHIIQSRDYSPQGVMSVSIAWRTRRVLIGIQSLNLVLLYSFDDPQHLIGSHQNGIGLIGFGKSVAWLDDRGEKAVILANSYSYSTYQWISSLVHVYDIQLDGFSDNTQPVLIYPNGQQLLFPLISPTWLRLVSSASGHVSIFDYLGNPAIIVSTPAGAYPDTNCTFYRSSTVPCIRGTHRNYTGIELCFPCPNGTYSSNCSPCTSKDSFCPYGAVEEISYSTFESIEQDQDYPESPENTVFDDLLMQNMFSFNTKSIHCILVSPFTWIFLLTAIGMIVAIIMIIRDVFYPGTHAIRDRVKQILRRMDIIGEGEVSQFSIDIFLPIQKEMR
jgi:hypothetical protein